jgi:hypothetical protein
MATPWTLGLKTIKISATVHIRITRLYRCLQLSQGPQTGTTTHGLAGPLPDHTGRVVMMPVAHHDGH